MSLRRVVDRLRRYAGSPRKAWRTLRALADARVVRRSPLFDAAWYARENPDAAAGGADLALHYVLAGAPAGLDPGPDFCGAEYLAANALPAAAGNPLAHYERIGRARGFPTALPTPSVSIDETEDRLRTKVLAGDPIRVLFFVSHAAMFPARPLFEAMLRDSDFLPSIAVVPDLRWPGRDPVPEMEACERELSEAGFSDRLRRVRPDASGAWPDLLLDADLVCHPSPYDQSDFRYNPRFCAGRPVLPFHVNYGYYRSVYDRHLMRKRNYALMWKVFLESEAVAAEYRTFALRPENAVVLGYVKMDRLESFERRRAASPPRVRKTILIAPHHSVEGGYNDNLALSNFLRYSEFFLALPERYPTLDFLFRPHPFLFRALRQPAFWGDARVDRYLAALRSHPNVRMSDGGDYFEEFSEADAIVQDCGSFLVEWFYTGRPCCYLLKSETDFDKFAPLGQDCLRHCRLAFDERDIDSFLLDVLLGGLNAAAASREAFRKTIMVNHPHASDAALASIRSALGLPLNRIRV